MSLRVQMTSETSEPRNPRRGGGTWNLGTEPTRRGVAEPEPRNPAWGPIVRSNTIAHVQLTVITTFDHYGTFMLPRFRATCVGCARNLRNGAAGCWHQLATAHRNTAVRQPMQIATALIHNWVRNRMCPMATCNQARFKIGCACLMAL
eukprot:scaffold9801_cov59-Phaeocystis_antarctica.AAC.1